MRLALQMWCLISPPPTMTMPAMQAMREAACMHTRGRIDAPVCLANSAWPLMPRMSVVAHMDENSRLQQQLS